jgi:hypothetical protein
MHEGGCDASSCARAAMGHASSAAAAKAVRPIKALWACNKRRLCDVLWLRSMAWSSMR